MVSLSFAASTLGSHGFPAQSETSCTTAQADPVRAKAEPRRSLNQQEPSGAKAEPARHKAEPYTAGAEAEPDPAGVRMPGCTKEPTPNWRQTEPRRNHAQ